MLTSAHDDLLQSGKNLWKGTVDQGDEPLPTEGY